MTFQCRMFNVYPSGKKWYASGMILTLCFKNKYRGGVTNIAIRSFTGQDIINRTFSLQSGSHIFNLSLKESGIYIIGISGNHNVSVKIICLNPEGNNTITYSDYEKSRNKTITDHQSQYELGYNSGDVVQYKGVSAKYKSIVTDSAITSKNIEFEFTDCTDPDGRS